MGVPGQTNLACIVCSKSPLRGKVWKHPRGFVCEDCFRLDIRCSLCGVPIKEGGAKTADGRFICPWDAPEAVLTAPAAWQVFAQTRAGLAQMTDSRLDLKSTNLTVTLFDVDYWNFESGRPVPEELRRMGFSKSSRDHGEIYHNICLWSGRLKSEIIGTCAHEYTHLWIHENRPASHPIERDTVEGICELVAYKLMGMRKEPAQQETIKTNAYTHGAITNLIEAETRFGLAAILDWVKSGTESKLDSAVLAGFRPPVSPPSPVVYLPRAYVPPNRLLLRGLGGAGKRRFALINDRSFAPAEERLVRVGDKTMLVHCLEIRDDSVVITVDGRTNAITLTLGGIGK